MCAIVGFASEQYGIAERADLVRLMVESRVRGLHAFGLAWSCDGSPVVVERYLNIADAIAQVRRLEGVNVRVVFHARYATSGDFRTLENNQPILLDQTALAFNGVLHMGTKLEMEQALGEPMTTDNDGEMFLRRVQRGENPVDVVRQGSFSGVWLQAGFLCALSNGRRPAWVISKSGTRIALSTRDIAVRAGLGMWQHEPLPLNEVVEVRP